MAVCARGAAAWVAQTKGTLLLQCAAYFQYSVLSTTCHCGCRRLLHYILPCINIAVLIVVPIHTRLQCSCLAACSALACAATVVRCTQHTELQLAACQEQICQHRLLCALLHSAVPSQSCRLHIPAAAAIIDCAWKCAATLVDTTGPEPLFTLACVSA